MEHRSSTDLDVYNWAFIVLAIVLAGLHLYLGLFAPSVADVRASQFVVIGFAFLFGPLIYFTPYWQPILYLLGAGFAAYLGILWVLGGLEYFLFGITTGITATVFFLLGLYLFLREETFSSQAET